MAFSMIVEMTSLTPRVTFSSPAIPAQDAPTRAASTSGTATFSRPGKTAAPATAAATYDAIVYCPSTPMLKRFIRKPIAAAIPER